MKSFRFYILLFSLGVVQIGIFSNILVSATTPNLFVITILWFARNRPRKDSYIAALIGGLMLDLFSAGFLGLNVLILALYTTLVHLFTSRFLTRDLRFSIRLLFYTLGLLLYEALSYLVVLMITTFDDSVFSSFYTIFDFSLALQIFYSLIVFYPLIYFAIWLLRHHDKRIE